MGIVATAAFDPIFWAHHAMIDRIWYLWQLRHGVRNIPAVYLDKAVFPGYTVEQVLDVQALGYSYGTSTATAGAEPGIDPVAEDGAVETNGPAPDAADTAEPGKDPDVQVPKEVGTPETSDPISTEGLDSEYSRADIEFHGVDHSGASYEGRVYLNNPEAGEDTGTDPESGYAGAFYVFGHGSCLGDIGHCDVNRRREGDPRGEHPLKPLDKLVVATKAVKRAQAQGGDVTVTVVPVVEPVILEEPPSYDDVLKYERVRIVTYR